MIELFFIALIQGVIGAAIGSTKKRAFEGFLWGFLLSFIGWIIIALRPTNGRLCPECKGVLADGARKCMHCGSELWGSGLISNRPPRVVITKKSTPRPIPAEVAECPYCNKNFSLTQAVLAAKTCPNCGQGFEL